MRCSGSLLLSALLQKMPHSKEGYLWTKDKGIVHGLETSAVLISGKAIKDYYDVVVIGSGFAGLVAARDIASRWRDARVLLIEGRDRIGGRTWTARALGEEFEMGGTWVHWYAYTAPNCPTSN